MSLHFIDAKHQEGRIYLSSFFIRWYGKHTAPRASSLKAQGSGSKCQNFHQSQYKDLTLYRDWSITEMN